MDLRSMLNNDATARQQPVTASQATFEQQVHTPARQTIQQPAQDSFTQGRPSPYPTPLRPPDQRTPGASYFPIHSPYHSNSASTPTSAWSAGAHSVPNLGTQGQSYNVKEGLPPQTPYNASFVSAPLQAPQPSTPGALSAHHGHSTPSSHSSTAPPPPFHQRAPSGDAFIPLGPTPVSRSQTLPHTHFQAQPAIPLGPPAQFQRRSPQAQRPSSQGYDHYRTYSAGSIGSAQSREHTQAQTRSPQQLRQETLQRQHSLERERSISVSPKTLPRPSPYPQMSIEGRRSSGATHPIQHKSDPEVNTVHPTASIETRMDQRHRTSTPHSSSPTLKDAQITPNTSSTRPSPAPASSQNPTPKSTSASLPSHESPHILKQAKLKRQASLVSGMTSTNQHPRKRLKRDEIPIFAQSARPNRPPKLNKGFVNPAARPTGTPVVVGALTPVSGAALTNGDVPRSPHQSAKQAWDPSILGFVPYEDLTRRVCDWIEQNIGHAETLSGGAVFEIEAKIGEIFDIEQRGRLRLPVTTETIFNKDSWGRTKFESSMNMAQHKQLNEFLNNLVKQSLQTQLQASSREPIYFDHPREADEFFELSQDGLANLSPAIKGWLNPMHKPRVRKTIDEKTGAVKAQIIKSRIADLEVYNPGADFDYRISISIESPWNGNPGWLTEAKDGGQGRHKDRMSYRHMAYQIDLTQVSYTTGREKEHELEVEISTEQIRKELDSQSQRKESRYEDLVRGFIDNVRILCRQGTLRQR